MPNSKIEYRVRSTTNDDTQRIGVPGPRATIQKPRKASKTESVRALVANPRNVEHDRQWQMELTTWLGVLASSHEKFRAPEYVTDLLPAVSCAAEMVSSAAMFISEHVENEDATYAIDDVLQHVGQYLGEAARLLSEKQTQGWWDRFTGKKPQVSIEACCRLIRTLPDVLERCITLLGCHFQQPNSVINWMDSSSPYLQELKQAIAWTEAFVPGPTNYRAVPHATA